MTVYLDIAGLRERWPAFKDVATERLQYLLDQAHMEVRAANPNLDEDIAAGRVTLDDVRTIMVRAIVRAQRVEEQGGEGIQSGSATTGPFTSSVTFVRKDNGDVYLTRREMAILNPHRRKDGKAFSIHPGGLR